MVSIDWSISVGNILTVLLLGVGAIKAYYRLQGDIRMLKHDFRNLEQAQAGMTEALGTLVSAVTQIAVQQSRLDHIEQDLSDLKRGEGFILSPGLPSRGPR